MYVIMFLEKIICYDCWFFFFFLISHQLGTIQKWYQIKWQHIVGTYLNIKKKSTKPKPIGKCQNKIFNFFKKIDFSFLKWKLQLNIPLPYYFSYLCKFSHQKKTCNDMKIWMFPITLSHFEKIAWIFLYDGCINHFWRR
jgi:hypothetical protein